MSRDKELTRGALKVTLDRAVPPSPSNPTQRDKNCSFRYPVKDRRHYFLTLICFVLHRIIKVIFYIKIMEVDIYENIIVIANVDRPCDLALIESRGGTAIYGLYRYVPL